MTNTQHAAPHNVQLDDGNTIYIFDEARLSQFIMLKDWDSCWDYIATKLRAIAEIRDVSHSMMHDFKTTEGIRKNYDFAAMMGKLILTLLMNDEVTMSDAMFYRLIARHELIHCLLYIISLENTDAQVQEYLSRHDKLNQDQQKKLCLLLSLNTSLDIVDVLKKVTSKYRAAAIIALLAHHQNYQQQQHDNKVKLLSLRKDVNNLGIDPTMVLLLVRAYFAVSYIDCDHKHDIKQNMNVIFKQYMDSYKPDIKRKLDRRKIPTDQQIRDRAKPVLVVAAESFSSNHAMFRSWGKLITKLSKYFEIHLIIPEDCHDPDIEHLFSDCYVMEYLHPENMFMHLEYLKPDVIVFPSVGMRANNIFLANKRYAPLQIMFMGHPATTKSPYIDFIVDRKELYTPEAFSTDKFIANPAPLEFTPLKAMERIKTDKFSGLFQKDFIQVGVAGALAKMSYSFIKFLHELQDEAEFPVKFSFMLNRTGPQAISDEIFFKKNFPNCDFDGWQDYDLFLEKIAGVDIVLCPFPFGHTNTLVDSLVLGKPCLAMEGNEPHGRTEKTVLEFLGMSDLFLSKSTDEYKRKFFDYARKILKGERRFFDIEETRKKLFEPREDNNFAEVIHYIYENRNSLRDDKRSFIELDEFKS